MGLKEQLDNDLKAAMRVKDTNRINTIRLLKAAISNFEIARGGAQSREPGKPITEADLLGVVDKQIKQRRESMELYKQGNRPELAAKEEAERMVLEGYVPKQLSREEIKSEVAAIIGELGTREFPKVMKEAVARLRGRADGKTVNEIVRALTA